MAGYVKKDPPSEFGQWRGKSSLTDQDMIELVYWVQQLDDQMEDALRYSWVNNEIFHPYAAIVRAMFAIFKLASAPLVPKRFPPSFLLGMEVIIHYALLKSYSLLGRKGGIRGNGNDRNILMDGASLLITCYSRFSHTQDFATDIFPIEVQQKDPGPVPGPAPAPPEQGRRRRRRAGLLHPRHKFAGNRKRYKKDSNSSTLEPFDENDLLDLEESHHLSPRYTYMLNHGVKDAVKKTRLDIDLDTNKNENVAISIFWLIYEILPPLCKWNGEKIATMKEAFEGILGLVLSLYL